MPSLEHDGVVELFRDNPALAPHFLERFWQAKLPPHTTVRVADSLISELAPVEFRADLVLELLDQAGKCVSAIVLECQRETDPRKRFSWPAYVAVCRAERKCSTGLLIVAVNAEVAKWAADAIDLGFGVSQVRPFVLGPKVLPEITDKQEARRDKELAVLSAMAHGNGPHGLEVVLATLAALENLDSDSSGVYFQIIWNTLREPMRKALEALVVQKQTRDEVKFPPFIQTLMDKRYLDGELKGYRDGEVNGEVKGEVKTLREKILRGAQRRGLVLTDEQAALISGCDDRVLLDRWFDNVFDATNGDEVLR